MVLLLEYNIFVLFPPLVVSNNLLGNTTLHNRSEGVTNRRSDQQYDDTSSGSYSEMCYLSYDVFLFFFLRRIGM